MVRGKEMVMAIALGAVTLLGACKKGDNAATDTTAAMAGTDTSKMATGAGASTSMNATPNAMNSAPMTDAGIFAMVAATNEGEIAAGKMASTKATDASVRAFAKDMVTAHGKMLSDGNALAKKLNITPLGTAADSLNKANQMMATELTNAPKGMTFDTTYVNGQVAGHQAVLDMITRAEGQAQNADLKSALTTAQGTVQKHLDRIKDIQGKMK